MNLLSVNMSKSSVNDVLWHQMNSSPKNKPFLTLKFQTCESFFLLLIIKDDILKNVVKKKKNG